MFILCSPSFLMHLLLLFWEDHFVVFLFYLKLWLKIFVDSLAVIMSNTERTIVCKAKFPPVVTFTNYHTVSHQDTDTNTMYWILSRLPWFYLYSLGCMCECLWMYVYIKVYTNLSIVLGLQISFPFLKNIFSRYNWLKKKKRKNNSLEVLLHFLLAFLISN